MAWRTFFWLPLWIAAILAVVGSTQARCQPAIPSGMKAVTGAPPWREGETLLYDIEYGIVTAAQAVFVTHERDGGYEFKLLVETTSLFDQIYPIQSWFWSLHQKDPWRSVEYGEWRSEGTSIYRERTSIDYDHGKGLRERWYRDKYENFEAPKDGALEDLVSMNYALRYGEWKQGDKRTFQVHEDGAIKAGYAECVFVGKLSVGYWPEQSVIKLHCEPTGDDAGKGWLDLYITNDAHRLPIEARLKFKYGTFVMRLLKADFPGGDTLSPEGN